MFLGCPVGSKLVLDYCLSLHIEDNADSEYVIEFCSSLPTGPAAPAVPKKDWNTKEFSTQFINAFGKGKY